LFGTEDDPDQAQPTLHNALSLINLEKNNFLCIKDENKVIAWSVVLPTSIKNMTSFLSNRMTEKDLFLDSINNPKFESLYLMSVIVLPEYRKKGLGSKLLTQQINYFKNNFSINNFYAMILSNEGSKLLEKLIEDLKIKISFVNKLN
ncbi:MAG: GNAT family N-acetyltransferase, partial [Candidatus Pacebacteria bacterium]|nr:GNAT family N-acetyltransferase [Candidatus Paceibacterota bacterium]